MEGGDAQAFAVRLGYNPVQVRRLVDRMGTDITQNELLSELVKLKGSLEVRNGCDAVEAGQLRHIVIDGANIVSNYGDADCRHIPIEICVGWFRERGHTEITVFVPSSWKDLHFSSKENDTLSKLEEASIMYSSEDDKVKRKKTSILKFVVQVDGILVSNDNYTGLVEECPEYAAVVEQRLLMYSFVKNRFMPPDDPLGRMGPTLDKFLQTSSFECLKPVGTKSHGRNAKGCVKGQRNNSPKYVKRTLSRLQSSKWKEMALPNELIRSYSDQGIRYCSLPSITESPVIDSLEDITLDTSKQTSDSSNHRPVIKNISDPTAIKMTKDHVTKQVAPPGKFNHSSKHQKVRRPVYDDFSRLSRDANYWRNQPAERPFEDPRNENFLRSHFSVPDISYGAAATISDNIGKMAAAGGNCYSSTPNFWTNSSCTEQVFNNTNSRYMLNIQSVYAIRAKLHYHLSALFPRDQVDTVFRLHPDETNPRKICSTLITLFPNV